MDIREAALGHCVDEDRGRAGGTIRRSPHPKTPPCTPVSPCSVHKDPTLTGLAGGEDSRTITISEHFGRRLSTKRVLIPAPQVTHLFVISLGQCPPSYLVPLETRDAKLLVVIFQGGGLSTQVGQVPIWALLHTDLETGGRKKNRERGQRAQDRPPHPRHSGKRFPIQKRGRVQRERHLFASHTQLIWVQSLASKSQL